MPGTHRQNNMFPKADGFTLSMNHPNPITSCGRRRSPVKNNDFDFKSEKKKNKKNWKSTEPRKTTKGKERNYRTVEQGAGMTQKGVDRYKAKNPGSKLGTAVTGKVKPGSKDAKRRAGFCARSKSWTGERGKAARARWKC